VGSPAGPLPVTNVHEGAMRRARAGEDARARHVPAWTRGQIGFDGQIELEALRLYGLPEAAPAVLNGTPLLSGPLSGSGRREFAAAAARSPGTCGVSPLGRQRGSTSPSPGRADLVGQAPCVRELLDVPALRLPPPASGISSGRPPSSPERPPAASGPAMRSWLRGPFDRDGLPG
jgi:hypothetical protein